MALTTIASRNVNEGNTLVYTTTLLDSASAAIPASNIDTITITLTDTTEDGAGTDINSRTAQDVKNANQVTIHATSGLLTWTSLPADHPIVNSFIAAGEKEKHTATFEMVYGTTKGLNWEVDIYVTAMDKVT